MGLSLLPSPFGDRPPVCSLGFYASDAACPRLNYAAYCVCNRECVFSEGKWIEASAERREGARSPLPPVAFASSIRPSVLSLSFVRSRCPKGQHRARRAERGRNEDKLCQSVSQSSQPVSQRARWQAKRQAGSQRYVQRVRTARRVRGRVVDERYSAKGGRASEGVRGRERGGDQGIGERLVLVPVVSLALRRRCGVSSLPSLSDHPHPCRCCRAMSGWCRAQRACSCV